VGSPSLESSFWDRPTPNLVVDHNVPDCDSDHNNTNEGTVNLVKSEQHSFRGATGIAQAAVAALQSLKERFLNSR